VPDIACNREIKFELLHKFAMEQLGVDSIATGHFVRNSKLDFPDSLNDPSPKGRLLRGKDPLKDQSYFLSRLTPIQLERSIFPVGHMTKPMVREMANEAGLDVVANKHDSMGICFVGKRRHFEDFLAKYIDPVSDGRFVLEETGETLPHARHTGVHNYTIGKRVGITGRDCINNEGLFVSRMDPKTQTIYLVSGSHHPHLFSTKLLVSVPYWISGDPDFTAQVLNNPQHSVIFRSQRAQPQIQFKLHRHEQQEGISSGEEPLYVLEPKMPIRAGAPGQVCVFYSGDECLGCAEIMGVLETLADRMPSWQKNVRERKEARVL